MPGFLTILFSCSAQRKANKFSVQWAAVKRRRPRKLYVSFLIDDVRSWTMSFSYFITNNLRSKLRSITVKIAAVILSNLSMIMMSIELHDLRVNFEFFIPKLYILIDIARRRRRNFLIAMGKLFMASRIFLHPSHHWNSNYFWLLYWLVAAFLSVGGNPEYFFVCSRDRSAARKIEFPISIRRIKTSD